ncbi:MAG: prepilin peptidase [Marinosulfonomonas sp.]
MYSDLMPLIWLSPILAAVGYFDLRYMRIPNALSLIGLALWVLSLTVFPPADLFARFAVAGIVFAIGFTGFFFRLLGGGDVKILTVLMLFVPLPTLAVFGNVFSASLVLGVSFVMTARRVPALAHVPFKSLSPNAGFPMGISIAMAGLVHPLVVTLLLG